MRRLSFARVRAPADHSRQRHNFQAAHAGRNFCNAVRLRNLVHRAKFLRMIKVSASGVGDSSQIIEERRAFILGVRLGRLFAKGHADAFAGQLVLRVLKFVAFKLPFRLGLHLRVLSSKLLNFRHERSHIIFHDSVGNVSLVCVQGAGKTHRPNKVALVFGAAVFGGSFAGERGLGRLSRAHVGIHKLHFCVSVKESFSSSLIIFRQINQHVRVNPIAHKILFVAAAKQHARASVVVALFKSGVVSGLVELCLFWLFCRLFFLWLLFFFFGRLLLFFFGFLFFFCFFCLGGFFRLGRSRLLRLRFSGRKSLNFLRRGANAEESKKRGAGRNCLNSFLHSLFLITCSLRRRSSLDSPWFLRKARTSRQFCASSNR